MDPQETPNDYFIWGIDNSAFGPVALPVLIEWIKDERVLPETWIFASKDGGWQKASKISELKDSFKTASESISETSGAVSFRPGTLRRIKILGDMKDAQLTHLADFLEFKKITHHAEVARQGEPGDAMYLVMSGELRARTMNGTKETILMTFGPGEFFGEMSLFDQGPQSADVVANVDSTVFRLSAASFERLTREMPILATPFLQATVRALSARIRADNKRLGLVMQQFSASREMR